MTEQIKNAIYIEVCAEVRYWEDATVNGVEDTGGTLIPFRVNECWRPVIRLADGMVMDWPQGTTADIHFKVCDAGEYWLMDDQRGRVGKWGGYYVPTEFLCHGPNSNGYGDYIIFKVGADGLIDGWKSPAIEAACDCEDEDEGQYKWQAIVRAAAMGGE